MVLLRSQGNAVVFISTTSPTATQTGDEWIDTSQNPPVVNVWTGSAWTATVSSSASITVGGITDTLEDYILERVKN